MSSPYSSSSQLHPKTKLNLIPSMATCEPSIALGTPSVSLTLCLNSRLDGDDHRGHGSSLTTTTTEAAAAELPRRAAATKRKRQGYSNVDVKREMRREAAGIEEEEDGSSRNKKLRLTKEQSSLLEELFREQTTLNPKQKHALAKQLKLRPRQVEVWFQNRRARTKLKKTEVDCELLKKCCKALTDENRRLKRELQELTRSIEHPTAASSLCPSCVDNIAGAARSSNGRGTFSSSSTAAATSKPPPAVLFSPASLVKLADEDGDHDTSTITASHRRL